MEIVRETVILSGKCQGILNELKCGNPDNAFGFAAH